METLSVKDINDFINEVTVGAKDKTRTISNITNSKIKKIARQDANKALKSGSGVSVAATASGALVGTGIGSAAIGGTGVAIGGMGAAAGAGAGAAAGSIVPIVGTAVGALIGVAIGIGISKTQNKNQYKTLCEYQEILKKQNKCIRDMDKEQKELERKFGECVKENERYKYIVSMLMSYSEIKKVVEESVKNYQNK